MSNLPADKKNFQNGQNSQQKNQYQAQLLSNRVAKQYKQLKKWARKNRITSYRLYDRDIPEIPLALDLYTFLPDHIQDNLEAILYLNEQNAAISRNDASSQQVLQQELSRTYIHMYLYERPYDKPEEEEQQWLTTMAASLAQTLNLDQTHILIKTRKKQSETQEGRRDQYEKLQSENTVKGIIFEQGQLFKINLTEYIDTGLFFDHRPLRDKVRNTCQGKSVLNLFCYTGSFSVYAAQGNASRVHSVDMSKTYIEWAQENMELNGFTNTEKYTFTRGDAIAFLNQLNAEVANKEGTNRFDIIVLDPPTFSNSKRTDNTLDINRDWNSLVEKCLNILTPKGILYFSTNSRRLKFDQSMVTGPAFQVEDITDSTIPEDYRNSKIHRAWKFTRV